MRPTMPALIEARDLTKKYGAHIALDRANFSVETGRIVGLIGPNGAGKTTALRAILGLTAYEGQLRVLGREPLRDRTELMRDASFIADVAVLPAWLRVDHAIDFVAGVHPRFRRDRAVAFLAKTQITGKRRMRELSKGMKTQVHLALTMAIDAKLSPRSRGLMLRRRSRRKLSSLPRRPALRPLRNRPTPPSAAKSR